MFPEYLPENEVKFFCSFDSFGNNEKMIRAFVMEDYSIGMHCQEFYEINIVLRGNGCHYINNGRIEVREGDTFIIPPNSMHGYASGKGFDVFHLLMSTEFFSKYIMDFCKLPSFFTLFDIEPTLRTKSTFVPSLALKNIKEGEIKIITDKLLQYSDQPEKENQLLLSNYCVIFIAHLCKAYTSDIKFESKEQGFIESLSLIYQNYNEKITLKRLCDTAHMSRTAYIQKFEELYKTTPICFLIKKRIDHAKDLLATTQYSTEKIAELTGFHDASHLIRFFIKYERISPTEFRKKNEPGANRTHLN